MLWDLIVNSDAKTFDEFDDYFRSHYNIAVDFKKYGELLSYHSLTCDNVNSSETLTTYCPVFSWSWIEDARAVYFNDRNFKLNFYNSSYELIGSTSEYTDVTSITVNETLWQNVLNSGDKFYVSVTIIENHEPKTDYEGQWYQFDVPVQTVIIDTNYTKALGEGDCYWYKFTATATADYIFETSGNVDTVGDTSDRLIVGRSINGLTYIYGSGGEFGNFRFTEYLTEGETIYIRIRGENWTATGTYVFNIEQVEHSHDYTDRYQKTSVFAHRSYCVCGEYTEESHHLSFINNQYACHYCGYCTKNPPAIKPEIMSFDYEDISYYYSQDEEYERI